MDRTQRVRVGDDISSDQQVDSGVPQGTVLGPCLFGVHIDDIDKVVRLIELLLKFADDCKGKKTIMNDQDRKALQDTLDKLCEWAETWGMKFNKEKCKILHVGNNNPSYEYYMQGTKLATIDEERDVGVIIHKSLKPSRQCQKAAATGMGVLYQLKNNFHFRDRHVFVKLFKQYVRPHLEFATPAWSPWLAADKQVLENVQKKFVNMIAGLRASTYEEKCKEIGLETLEERREVQDMAQAFKMIQGNEKLEAKIFNHVDGGRTRQDADELNLKLKPARLDIRRNFFTQRIVKKWNEIPAEIKRSKNVSQFKMQYKKMHRKGPVGRPEERS
jgi:hypothetical protein